MKMQFDAIAYAQRLEAAGVPKDQAEVHAQTLAHVVSDCVARPSDLHELRNEFSSKLRVEITQSEARLGAKIDTLKESIGYVKWMNALTLALLIGLIVKTSFA